jgi:phosphate:Na+ symporter
MLFLFFPFIDMVSYIVTTFGPGDPTRLTGFTSDLDPNTLNLISSDSKNLNVEQLALKSQLIDYQMATAYGLSIFHTLFNIINTMIMIWFAKFLAKIVSVVIKQKDSDEDFQLKYISTGMLSTSELSLLQARKEMKVYSERTQRMFMQVRELYYEENDNKFTKAFSRIEKYEGISDRMEVEIARYLTKVAEGRLSEDGKLKLQTMLKVISEIESIADSCFNLARIILRKKDDNSIYTSDMNSNVDLMMNLLELAIYQMIEVMDGDHISVEEFDRAVNVEHEINNFRNQLKIQNVVAVNSNLYEYQASVTYMDIIVECEKMADYVINIMEALNETTFKK